MAKDDSTAKDAEGKAGNGGKPSGDLASTRILAACAILVEAIWPTLFALVLLAAIFLGFAWFGLFARLGDVLRLVVLALFAGAAAFVLWRGRSVRMPSTAAIERRIEAASHLDHQPLQTQTDRDVAGDPFAQALWREHQRRMAMRLGDLSSGAPRTRTERLDPFGLRALVAVLLLTAFAYSHGSNGGRIADAFAPPAGEMLAQARVDAWVTPPSYTGRAPIFLTDQAAAEARTTIDVPQGSVLSVRVSNGADTTLSFTPAGAVDAVTISSGLKPREGEGSSSREQGETIRAGNTASPTDPAPGAGEYEFSLATSGAARLATTFRTLGDWTFAVTPDKAPTIDFAAEPTAAKNGSLELGYRMSDDYGLKEGRAEIEVDEAPKSAARPLVEAPTINLAMPRRTKGDARGRTVSNLTESPYAGAKIRMTLVGVDDAGQVGRSPSKAFVLPERRFSNPLARAVIEQRRILALDGNSTQTVVAMLDALTIRDGEYIARSADYLALRAARTRIATATNDETLLSAVDLLWQIALGIEDGNLSLAEKKVRDARENLANALDKGASDQEIEKLMAELRQAMQDYLQSMAEAMKSMPPMSQKDMQAGNMQEIRPQDIDKMLKQIEDLAKSGSKDAAKQLLSQLQSMLDNLQAIKPGQQPQNGEQNAMQQQMDKMADILRRQQELKDKTFDLGRQQIRRQQEGDFNPSDPLQPQQQQGEAGAPRPDAGEKTMTEEELKQALSELESKQGQLQKDLQDFQKGMKGMGLEPGKGLGEANEAMGRAKGALGKGDDSRAVGHEGEAMEALRSGAKDMMSQMQQAMQGQQGQRGQQGQMGEGYGRGEQRSGRDPLGRPRSTEGMDFGQDVKVPDEIDTQRARRILDTIRNRLGNSLSPQMEKDYLERLLKTP